MAWIQVHQQLKDHRKLLAAADDLEIEPAHMLGLLISFWLWALDNAPSGSLEGVSNRMIARAAQWDGAPDVFVDAMAHAGLLDITPEGSLELHDWYEYAGKLIDQRESEKNRSRRRRAAAAASADDRGTTAGHTANSRQKTGGRVDQTIPDQSIPEKGDTPPTPQTGTNPDAQERRFAEFWSEYPKKKAKKDAQKAWNKIKPTAELFENIMDAVKAAKNSMEWNKENGRFIPNPATWLNGGRWDDELTPAPITSQQTTGNGGKPDTRAVLARIIAEEEGGYTS